MYGDKKRIGDISERIAIKGFIDFVKDNNKDFIDVLLPSGYGDCRCSIDCFLLRYNLSVIPIQIKTYADNLPFSQYENDIEKLYVLVKPSTQRIILMNISNFLTIDHFKILRNKNYEVYGR